MMPFARASSRKAAPASAEPPPSPAATGMFFSRTKAPGLEAVDARAQRGRRLEHQIVGDVARSRRQTAR